MTLSNVDLRKLAERFQDEAAEIKCEVADSLVKGFHASFAIERLTRARKLESIASSVMSLRSRETPAASTQAPCTCADDDAFTREIEMFGQSTPA